MSKSLKYVSDFEFPSDFGFKGSAGKTMVKGYARGGSVKGVTVPTVKASKQMDGRGYACGGKAKYAEGGKVGCKDAKKAVHKHEAKMHPGKQKTEFFGGGKVKKAIGMMKEKVAAAAPKAAGDQPKRGGLLSRVSKLRGIGNAQNRAPAHAAVQAKPLQRPAGGLGSLLARGKGEAFAARKEAMKAAPESPMQRKFGRAFNGRPMFGR